jgi:GlpG protein
MRQIGTLPDETAARQFGDYLLTQNIANDVEPAGNEWAIWVHDDRRIEAAEEHLRVYHEMPDKRLYANAAAEAARIRAGKQADDRRAADQTIDLRTERQRRASAPRPLTYLILLSAIIVGVFTRVGQERTDLFNWFVYTGIGGLKSGQVWRLFTPMLLHLGLFHVLFNLYWLHSLGGQIEGVKGTRLLAVLVFVTEGLTNVAAGLLGEHGVGLSAVVYGLFGYIWMKEKFQPGEGLRLGPGTAFLMIAWFFICLTGAVGRVGNIGHASGLLIGLAFGIGPYLLKRTKR